MSYNSSALVVLCTWFLLNSTLPYFVGQLANWTGLNIFFQLSSLLTEFVYPPGCEMRKKNMNQGDMANKEVFLILACEALEIYARVIIVPFPRSNVFFRNGSYDYYKPGCW